MKFHVILLLALSLCILSCKTEKKDSNTPSNSSAEDIQTSAVTQKVSTLTILPIEHASLVLEWNDITIYIDPAGKVKRYGSEAPDLVLITDIHGDHMNIETLDSLNLSTSKIITPAAVAEKLPAEYTNQLVIMNNGETQEVKGIKIEAVPMYNLREEALKFHKKGRGNGYVITLGDERFYFSGDTEDIPEMRNLKNIDRAFVCMNLPWTMTVENAADAVLEFKPKIVYPYHYRGKEKYSDVAKFKEIVNTNDPNIKVEQLHWYPEKGK
ncbi:MBL fold metallo-hydrolase [Aquimarina sp. 2201CG5-10]|uniref:MBL fold metallo-hydrolase n=1 Tax=Aquimarina callyspongiae TaxID=3098150 RepID=UPI002AB3BA6C|nr:MBL fold metallo-hydrolase [Aquimarina sp. 2201CG5-10]MDY8136175.1 MBL fold metallo-hydrolase [Aquimarina sp. 2201CG5-10]